MMRLSLLHVDTLHILESCNPIQQKIAQKNIKPNFKSTVFAEIDPSSISAVISKVEYLDPDFFLLILQETNGKTSNVPFRLICSCGFSPLSSLPLFDAHITRLHLHHPFLSHILLLLSLSLYVTFHIHDSWLLSDTGLQQLLWNSFSVSSSEVPSPNTHVLPLFAPVFSMKLVKSH